MNFLKTLVLVLLVDAGFAHAALSDKDIETLFDGHQHCTKLRVGYGFSFWTLDQKYQGREKSYLVKDASRRECIQMPAGLSGALMAKDECDAYIVVFPSKANREEARYVFSKIHTNPAHARMLQPAFDASVNPVASDKDQWNKLVANYNKIRKSGDSETSKLVQDYKTQYAQLRQGYLRQNGLRAEDIHIAKMGWAGCH